MKSLSFRIPADLYNEIMRGDSRQVDNALDEIEESVRRRLFKIVDRRRREDRLIQKSA